jgi:hypothetical protein
VAWISAGATWTGGIAGLVVSRLRGKNNKNSMMLFADHTGAL